MVQEGVDQGSEAAARAWMDEQAAGLVDDRHVRVGVENIQGDELGFHRRRRRKLDVGLDHVPFPEGVAGLFERPVDPDLLLVDEPLELGPGEIPDLAAKKDIQPDALPEARSDAEDPFSHARSVWRTREGGSARRPGRPGRIPGKRTGSNKPRGLQRGSRWRSDRPGTSR